MTREQIERFRKLHNIPESGAVARVTGGRESRAVIRTANGETFRASCTRGACEAMETAMKKWQKAEEEPYRRLRGF